MLFSSSRIRIFDNSGFTSVSYISGFGSKKKKGSTVGDFFIASVKKLNLKKKKSKYKKGSLSLFLIIKLAKNVKRYGLWYLKSERNGAISLSTEKLPLASRLFGVVYKEIKILKISKIILLSEILI
jgi:large subunit ribosomal protein L14